MTTRLQRFVILGTLLIAMLPAAVPRWETEPIAGNGKYDLGRHLVWDRPNTAFATIDSTGMLHELLFVVLAGGIVYMVTSLAKPPTLRSELGERLRKTRTG